MARQTIYTGQFLSRSGVTWQADIWRVVATITNDDPGELTFPAEEPLVIEWADRGKEVVLCGSSCTLRIESPGDRTYVGLYTEAPCTIGLDVYRDGSLYWRGTLDTEQYEEPYERYDMYDVALTFSDLGVLDRLDYSGGGLRTMEAVFEEAMTAAMLGELTVDTSMVSSSLDGGTTPLALSALQVDSRNFYDEDGEPNTLAEVVEGMLQPLALRLVQRAGKLWLYDLNGLATLSTPRECYWTGDTQTLGVDRVFNNIKVTFSPYGDGELMSEDDAEFTDEVDEEATNYDHGLSGATMWTFFPDELGDWDWQPPMHGKQKWPVFTIHKGAGKGFASLYADEDSYFRIVAQGGGEDSVGYLWGFKVGGSKHNANYDLVGHAWNYTGCRMYTTRRVYLPPIPASSIPSGFGGSAASSVRWMLRLCTPMLADCRYNPFGEDSVANGAWEYVYLKTRSSHLKRYANYVAHFAHLVLWSAETGGNVLYHYDNTGAADGRPSTAYLGNTAGAWVQGAPSSPKTVLMWYDKDSDRRNRSTGIMGWKGNRHTIGRGDDTTLTEELKNAPDGQFIPYPPSGGWLEFTLMSQIYPYDGQNTYDGSSGSASYASGSLLYWMLYKHPVLEVVRGFGLKKVEVDDIEMNAWANANAREELSLDTICGTLTTMNPCARGAIRLSSSGALAYNMTRAGRTDRMERLWLGTLYSQFAARHTKLEGEASIDHEGLCAYTEPNQGEKLFISTSETEDVITDTTERVMVELTPDEYEAEIFEEQ